MESGVTILVTPENGTDTGSTYTPGTTYTVIQTGAAGNLTVDADPTITDDFAFLDFTGNTDGQNYYLTSHQVASFCRPGMTFNQCSTANAVEDLGAGHLAYDSVLHLSTAEADAALDAMSGEVHASGQHVIDQTFALFNRTLRYQGIAGIGAGNFGANVASAPAGDYADARVRGAWAAPLGAYGRIDSDGNAARLEWWNAGLAGGYEGVIDMGSGNAVGGFGFGYIRSHGSIPDRRSTFDGDGIYLGAYGAWNDGPWTVAGALSYGANRVSTERGIVFGTINETATADYWAHTVGLSGEAAYAFDLSDSTKLAPLFTLDAGWSGHGGFTERGAGVFNLSSGSESWTRFDTGIGLALTHTVLTEHGKLTLEGRAVWEHAFADVVPDTMNSFVGGTPFEIRGPAAAADRLRIGGGLSWAVSDDMTIRARYDGLFSGDQSNHSASLGLNVRF
ncbi:autotransporter outer membrane beta-barrel domain-containing protein [Paracoccus sp. P2]|uniref:autotransporter outer membrane beta-barrel domain-containing protein n=1 Tax=Paracoccus sp. P2 TaxID=3248840 RepID=UPI00391FB691